MARSDGGAGPLRRHEGAVAVLGAAVLAAAMLTLPTTTPSRYDAPDAGPVAPPAAALAPPSAAIGMTVPGPAPVTPPEDAAPAAPSPAVPSPAPAAALPEPAAPLADDVQLRVQQAIDSLGYPWQELGWDLRFAPYEGGLLGLADPATRQLTVYVKATSTVQQLRVVLAHEIGHALDVRHPEQRERYRAVRGIPADVPWFPCARCEDYATPAGDFAEVFAAWLVGATDFRSRVAPLPDDAQWRELAPLFAPPSARASADPAPQQPRRPRSSASPSPRPLLGVGPGG